MKVYTRKIIGDMWAKGMPSSDDKFANIYRAALKAGLTDEQAFALTRDAYNAAHMYEWNLDGWQLKYATQKANAAAFPNGKCAEDLKAISEGRPSRWGTPDFHRPSKRTA